MNYEKLWHEHKRILNILKRSNADCIAPTTLIILMDQQEQNQRLKQLDNHQVRRLPLEQAPSLRLTKHPGGKLNSYRDGETESS